MAEHVVTWIEQAPTVTPVERPRKKRRKVEHLFNTDALEFANIHQLPCRSFCGAWVSHNPRQPKVVTVFQSGGLQKDDCARCVAVYHRILGDIREGKQP